MTKNAESFFSALAFLLLWIVPVEGIYKDFRVIDILNARPVVQRKTKVVATDDVVEAYFKQRLDHFRPTDTRTYQQRYFYSDRFVRNNGSKQKIAFLCVGGEGPALDRSVLTDSVHCSGDMLETAKVLHEMYFDISIHLYALEHRYYGESFPDFGTESPVSNKNLVFLSSRQALRDLVHFCTSQLKDEDVTWVTFGGSYPGVLAAWARLIAPHVISAAISNSAPVQAKMDMTGYKNHVAQALSDETIGGSWDCLQLVAEGHAELAQVIEQAGDDEAKLEMVANAFSVCNFRSLLHRRNAEMLLGEGVYFFGTQGNDPSCTEPMCNIAKSCEAGLNHYNRHHELNTTTSAMNTLAWMVKEQKRLANVTDCVDLDWNASLTYLQDPNSPDATSGDRSWLWQTCTEFGFYQTCEKDSECPFGKGWHLLEQDLELCRVVYNISDPATTVRAAVDASNLEYGGYNIVNDTTHILSITGTVDPWTEQSLKPYHSQPRRQMLVESVKGASHHFWTHAVKEDTDSPAVKEIRLFIQSTILEWLGHRDNVKDDWPQNYLKKRSTQVTVERK